MVAKQESAPQDRPDPKGLRTLAAVLSAMLLSAIVWGAVVLFDVH
jgi:hypothetical protein